MSLKLKLKHHKKGQTLIEFALILPVLLLLVMAIIQFGIIFSAQVGITNAAREGARMAAVGHNKDEVTARVKRALGSHISLSEPDTEVDYPSAIGEDVEVSVNGTLTLIVPVPDLFVPGNSITLNATASMRAEQLPKP